jgi:AcrR family transcriptional regulator
VTSPDDQRPPGRPRAPDLEERALAAVLDVFGEKGWTGLTIAEVASRARVGKSSLYLRWPNKAAMLADALRQVQAEPADQPTDPTADPDPAPAAAPDAAPAAADDAATDPADSLRDYLVAHAQRRADLYLGKDGLAMLRLYVEARAFPVPLADVRHEAITRFVLSERQRVERAIREGELPPGTSAVHLLDAIEGSVLMHVLVTPPHLLDRVRSTMPAYLERMVDLQLAAATAPAAAASGAPEPAPRAQPSRNRTPNPPRG